MAYREINKPTSSIRVKVCWRIASVRKDKRMYVYSVYPYRIGSPIGKKMG
ncbi:MAG: hypothetical protein QXH94_05305 [Sulfolobales archaeon]